ncbi:MAG: flagellar M-ring protein FliF, partial [Chloroflexi bacterium]|nr:flagellar M-ring protein FliF [Chloroflexota bacterium]
MLASLQQQLGTFWQHQSRAQRITLMTLGLAAAVLIPLFIVWATQPTYSVAFTGLSEEDAGQIIEQLDASQIAYQLRDSGTILVSSDQVYEVRLRMAREGLPKSGSVGFDELFSGNTLGMTEFTQRVNYQRALEGELERTIGSLKAVNAVRVHIVTPEKTLLSGEQAPTTASVTIQPNTGMSLDAASVQSITHLVASSIEGLQPENVVVVDTDGNMLASGNTNGEATGSLAQSDGQRTAEAAAAGEIRQKVQNILDSVLGPNRSVVQANVIMDWTQREITSQTFDPTPAAIRSSQKSSETYTTNGDAISGVPGAASNLPTPVATDMAGSAGYYQSTDETLNYELSQVQTHEVETPGKIERISLSVLVDGIEDAQQLDIIKTAVAAAAGIDETRGDTLAVETLAFDRSYYETQAADLADSQQTDLY